MNPTFYWYASARGALRTLSLGEELSDLQIWRQATAEEVRPGEGAPERTLGPVTERVRLVVERVQGVGGWEVERQLVALESHLLAGGAVGLALEPEKAWAGVVSGAPEEGDTLLRTGGHAFGEWSSPALQAGDLLVVESGSPTPRTEVVEVAGETGGQFELAEGLVFGRGLTSVVRHRHFWPLAWRPVSDTGPIVVHERQVTWTVDLTLESAVDATLQLWSAGGTAYSRDRWWDLGALALGSSRAGLGGRGGLGLDGLLRRR